MDHVPPRALAQQRDVEPDDGVVRLEERIADAAAARALLEHLLRRVVEQVERVVVVRSGSGCCRCNGSS